MLPQGARQRYQVVLEAAKPLLLATYYLQSSLSLTPLAVLSGRIREQRQVVVEAAELLFLLANHSLWLLSSSLSSLPGLTQRSREHRIVVEHAKMILLLAARPLPILSPPHPILVLIESLGDQQDIAIEVAEVMLLPQSSYLCCTAHQKCLHEPAGLVHRVHKRFPWCCSGGHQ